MSVYTELFSYRELFANLFRRDLQKRYKGSVLGVLWVLLPPLILMGIYLLVFHVLWRASQVPRYPLYLLAGLTSWVFFATTLQVGSRAMVDNAELDWPAEPPHPRFKTKLGAIEYSPFHEYVHAGQIAMLRRLMGKPAVR